MQKKIIVLGIGNILLKDDGVGIVLVNLLADVPELTQNIKFVDCGTSVLETLVFFLENDIVIILDALKGGHPPGTVYKIRPEDIKNYQKENLSLHDVQILDVIQMAALYDKNPEVIIYGIEPAKISYDLDLSNILQLKLELIKNFLIKELQKLKVI